MPSRTVRKLTFAILLTAVIPLVTANIIASSLVSNISTQLYNPKVGEELDRSLDLYKELAASVKAAMRYQAEAIASQEGLRAAAVLNHQPSIDQELSEIFPAHPNLVRLAVIDSEGESIAEKRRPIPVNEATELALEVTRRLSEKEDGPALLAVFVTAKARFDERDGVEDTVRTYRQIEASRSQVERAHLVAFGVLIAITVLAAVVLGTLLSRSVTRRLAHLARVTTAVGAGDLAVRAPVQGDDEITELAKAFNHMLLEVQRSRARVEFLQRMGTWQDMARRLAHEIKNPLTPIQLAVEEIHARYRGDDDAFRGLLDTAHGVVVEEVATLRRLVTEFSAYARLPRASLSEADVCRFVREQQTKMLMFGDDESGTVQADGDLLENSVDVSWAVPDDRILVNMDCQMMHRVMANLVRNAGQAVSSRGSVRGKVRVSLKVVDKDWVVIEVDDDGPGIPLDRRERVFDPYYTTKSYGTGLGLSIVKKIVMEHGGSIEATDCDLGGARMAVLLPRIGSAASLAALAEDYGTGESGCPSV